MSKSKKRIKKALKIVKKHGNAPGNHHKAWMMDQMVRALTGDKYDTFIKDLKAGENGPDTYDWDTGIAP